MGPSTLRLLRFRPTVPGFDRSLRATLLPEVVRLPGILGVVAGRRGPAEDGHRLIATLWKTRDAMVEALGDPQGSALFHPELEAATVERTVLALPVELAFDPEPGAQVGIVRLVIGRARGGALDDYVAQAREGTAADRARLVGPRALYLAVDPPDQFATLSLWETWGHVQEATGARDAEIRTQHADQLAEWHAEHYEALPGWPIRVATASELTPGTDPG